MSSIAELLDSFNHCNDYQQNISTIGQLHLAKTNLPLIATNVYDSTLPETEKDKLIGYIFTLSPIKHDKKIGTPLKTTSINQYINLIFASGRIEQELPTAIEITKNSITPKSYAAISNIWRNVLNNIYDYNEKIRLFCRIDAETNLDDRITKELFSSYNYGTDMKEMQKLIQTELALAHSYLLERLIKCLGSIEKFIELSGMTESELTYALSHASYMSNEAEVTGSLIIFEIQRINLKNPSEYEQLTLQYAKEESHIACNLCSLAAYEYFLAYGCFSPKIKKVLNSLPKKIRASLNPIVIKAYIRCVEKCLDEDLNIQEFIEDTASVSMFHSESDLKPLDWNAIKTIDENGLKDEAELANARLDELFAKFQNKPLLCYIFMNTHFGAMCNLKKLAELLYNCGENLKELFYPYPISGYVVGTKNYLNSITVHSNRYNIDNAKLPAYQFQGVIYPFCNLSYRITGISQEHFGKDDMLLLNMELVPTLRFDLHEIYSCIEEAKKGIHCDKDSVLHTLQSITSGEQYAYSKIGANLYKGLKNMPLQATILKFLKEFCKAYNAEDTLELFMNTFIRILCPLEEVCKILIKETGIKLEHLNELLYPYEFPGIRKYTQNGHIFKTGAIYLQNPPTVDSMQKNTSSYYLQATDIHGNIQLQALCASKENLKLDTCFIRKQIQIKLEEGSQNPHLLLAKQKIISDAKHIIFTPNDYLNFVEGFYLRCLDISLNLTSAIDYLKYYAPINPFDYTNCARNFWIKDFIQSMWPSIRHSTNSIKRAKNTKERLLSSRLSFAEISYIYMNSPLRYEYKLTDFLIECMENFIDTTPNICLIGHNRNRNCIFLPGISGFGANGQLISFPPEVAEQNWFTFELTVDWDANPSAVNVKPYKMNPIKMETPLTQNQWEHISCAADFFENKENRFTYPVNHIFAHLIDYDHNGECIIDDLCGKYRIFGKISYVSNRAFLSPLNTIMSSATSLKVYLGSAQLDENYIYAMVPYALKDTEYLRLLPTAQYEASNVPDWKNCLTEDDVSIAPLRTYFPEIMEHKRVSNFSPTLLKQYPKEEFAQLIERIQNSTFHCMFSIPSLINLYYRNTIPNIANINNVLKNLIIFAKKQASLTALNTVMTKQDIVPYIHTDDGPQPVAIYKNTNAIFAMRFLEYTHNDETSDSFHFVIEETYEYDTSLPWCLYKDMSDVSPLAKKYEREKAPFYLSKKK